MTFQPPRPERIAIPGPAGDLQAVIEVPEGAALDRCGVVCHPHPLHGGTLDNKVVHAIARAFNELGVATVRFNFRGVCKSAGAFANGIGETEDALAVIEYARKRWPNAALWLGGFSFGGAVAVRAAEVTQTSLLVTVSPAVTRFDLTNVKVPACPWLVVQGDPDDVVEAHAVLAWAAQLQPPPTVKVLPGAGHFFHGRLHELRETILEFARAQVFQA